MVSKVRTKNFNKLKYSTPRVKKTKLQLKIWGGASCCVSGY